MARTECEEWPIIGFTPAVDLDAGVLAAAKQAAQLFLSGLTATRHFGVCTYDQRFQVRGRHGDTCSMGRWDSLSAIERRDGQCCAIKLPVSPVQSIVEVRVDGVAIDPVGYTMVAGNRLIRTAGCWPSSDDRSPGRVEITYTAGIPLTEGSRYYGMVGGAMGEVTREYVAAFTGGTCKLPSRFVSVARQGVTTQALDPALFLNLGLTGLPLTDNLVRTVNPRGMRRRPRVVSIDGPRRR